MLKGKSVQIVLTVLLLILCLSSVWAATSLTASNPVVTPKNPPPDYSPQKATCVYAGSDVLVIQDVYTWGMEQLYNAPDGAACSDMGISYDVITTAVFATSSLQFLQDYKAIVLMADQPQSFYDNIYANKEKLADYVSNGGVLSAVVYQGWTAYVPTQQFLPGGAIFHYDVTDDVNFSSSHFIISNPSNPVSLDAGPYGYNSIIDNIQASSSFYFTDMPSGWVNVAWDLHGHSVLAEYTYGQGKVVAVGIPIEWFYRYKLGLGGTGCQEPWDGANNLRLLYNELIYQSSLQTGKDRLLSALDKLQENVHEDILFLARTEAEMNAAAYDALTFDTNKFIAEIIVDLASDAIIGIPPTQVADLKSLQYLNALSKVLQAPQLGIKGADVGLCLGAATDYIKQQGITTLSGKVEAYYDFIMGTQPSQISGSAKTMPFVQSSDTFSGLNQLLTDLESDYAAFRSTIVAANIPESESVIELCQYLNNLEYSVGKATSVPSVVKDIVVSSDNREVYQENELGFILNFKDQQNQLISQKGLYQTINDACLVTKVGAVAVKVVNILALGMITPIQIVVTGAAAASNIASTIGSSMELSVESLIAGNKMQSTICMGSEIVRLKQLLEDSQNYVNWRLTHAKSTATGEIVEYNIPNVITDGFDGSQTGTITVRNTGSSTAKAIVHVEIFGPTSYGNNEMLVYFTAAPSPAVDISPGATQVIQFDYSVLDLSLMLQCSQYKLIAYVSLDGTLIGPAVTFFNAGLTCNSQFSTVLSGNMQSGQTLTNTVTIDPGTIEARFDLSYAGSDFDLHIYDSRGGQVGYNYSSGQVISTIPNATYSGPLANPEWITLPVTGGMTFQVSAAAIVLYGNESVAVTLTQYKPCYAPSVFLNSTAASVTAGQNTAFKLTVQNRGTTSDTINLALSGLNPSMYQLSKTSTLLAPNQTDSVSVSISTSTSTAANSYPFTVTATSQANQSISDSATALLTVLSAPVPTPTPTPSPSSGGSSTSGSSTTTSTPVPNTSPTSTPESTPTPTTSTPTPHPGTPTPAPSNNTTTIIVITIIGAIIAAAVAGALFWNSKRQP